MREIAFHATKRKYVECRLTNHFVLLVALPWGLMSRFAFDEVWAWFIMSFGQVVWGFVALDGVIDRLAGTHIRESFEVGSFFY